MKTPEKIAQFTRARIVLQTFNIQTLLKFKKKSFN